MARADLAEVLLAVGAPEAIAPDAARLLARIALRGLETGPPGLATALLEDPRSVAATAETFLGAPRDDGWRLVADAVCGAVPLGPEA